MRGLHERVRRGVERIVAEEAERIGRQRVVAPHERPERGEHPACGRVVQRISGALFVLSRDRRRQTVEKIDVWPDEAAQIGGVLAVEQAGERRREPVAHGQAKLGVGI